MSKKFTRLTIDFAYDEIDSSGFTQFIIGLIDEIEDSVSWGQLADIINCSTGKLQLMPTGDTFVFNNVVHQHADTVPADNGDPLEPTDEITDDIT
jgi:hypothetical protein